MPELPEMEAWRRQLDGPVSAFPIAKAGPAHIATLKTFDPPLVALEGKRFSGAKRRAKRLLFPTDDGELVLMVHLMSAGRLRYVRPEEACRRVGLHTGRGGGGARAHRPGGARPRPGAARGDPRGRAPTAPSAAPRPARDRRHRPRVGERDPPYRAAVALQAVDRPDRGRGRATVRRDRRRACTWARAPRAREEGRRRLPRPRPSRRAVPRLRRPAPPRRLRGAHDLLLPDVPDRREGAEGPPSLAPPPLVRTRLGPGPGPCPKWASRVG